MAKVTVLPSKTVAASGTTTTSAEHVLSNGLSLVAHPLNYDLPSTGPGAKAGALSQIKIPHMDQGFDTPEEATKGNKYPTARSTTVTTLSKGGAEAAAETLVTNWNPDIFTPPTTNGSGANSITYTYQDKANGILASEILSRARMNLGAVCFGVQQRFLIASGGSPAADTNGLANANGNWQTYTIFGNPTPDEFDESSDQSRSDFDLGITVLPCVQNLARQVNYQFYIQGQTGAYGSGYYNQVISTFYFTRKYKK